MDFYGFYTGQIFDAHQWLGAHIEGKQTVFRTFAPAAKYVELYIHDVAYEMKCIHDGNFYEVTVSNIQDGDSYYYKIWGADGKECIHSDPFGFGMELRPKYFSIVRDLKPMVPSMYTKCILAHGRKKATSKRIGITTMNSFPFSSLISKKMATIMSNLCQLANTLVMKAGDIKTQDFSLQPVAMAQQGN